MKSERRSSRRYRWLLAGIALGLLSALSGWHGIQGWSGQAGGNPFFAWLGAPFLLCMFASRSWLLGVLGSVVVWTGLLLLGRLMWGRLPESWRHRAGQIGPWVRRNRWQAAGVGAVTVGAIIGGIVFVRENRGVREVSAIHNIHAAAVDSGRIYAGTGPLLLFEATEDGDGITELSETSLPLGLTEIDVSGSTAYVASRSGFQVVDVSDASEPALLGSLEWRIPGGSWISLAVSGDLAVVSHDRESPGNEQMTEGISLVDISDPRDPVELSVIGLPGGSDHIADLEAVSSLVFVAARLSGLFVFDVSEPYTPALLARYEPRSWSRGIAVEGDYAYLSVSTTRGSSWIHVLDIGEPSRPTPLTTIKTRGPAQKLSVDGGHLYLADHMSGLKVFDVSTPAKPRLVGRFRTNGMFGSCCLMAGSVAASDGLVVVLTDDRGFVLREKS